MLNRTICFLLLLLPVAPLSVEAQLEQATAEIIALEIRNLSTSVDRLTRLLYDQAQKKAEDKVLRKLDIAVAYLNFRSRRIEVLERDLQSSHGGKNRMEDIIRQWEQRMERIEQQAADNTGSPEDVEINRVETAQQLKMLKQRLARLDSEIVGYENRITELQNQIDNVESFVERHLEL